MRIPRIYLAAPLSSGQSLELDANAFNHAVLAQHLSFLNPWF